MRRNLTLAALLVLAACSSTPSDGFNEIGSGDTYGEWDAFAEIKDGKWTGCMRVDHVLDGVTEECSEPTEDLIVFEGESIQYGALRDGKRATFGGETPLSSSVFRGDDLGVGYRFFVVANNGDNPVELED